MIDRIATPKGLAVGISLIGVLVAASVLLGAYALVKQKRTDRQVEKIAQRVFVIEQPTAAQKKKGLKRAVKELTGAAGAEILDALLKSATPAQRRELRTLVRGGGHANSGQGQPGPGAKPGPSPNVPPVTVPSVTTPPLPAVPPVTTPPVTTPPVTLPPLPCLPNPVPCS